MPPATLSNALIGPFHDLRRFVAGAMSGPPLTRRTAAAELSAARAVLSAAECDLTGCTEENLHTATVPLAPEAAYDRFAAWQAWPCSGFFACPHTVGEMQLFSYRFWGVIPVVRMQLFSAVRPAHIIHRVLWGFGAGGYHCFLFAPANPDAAAGLDTQQAATSGPGGGGADVSIFTIYPPQPFLTGLHDQTNWDIFRLLRRHQS